MSTQPETQADRMKRTVTRWVTESINTGNTDLMHEIYAPDVVFHGPGGLTIHGLDGLREMVTGYTTAFPGMQMTVHRMLVEGDWIAVHWSIQGTHTGPMGDLPPTGRSIDIHGHIQSRFENGRVVEEWEIWDEAAMQEQLGLTAACI